MLSLPLLPKRICFVGEESNIDLFKECFSESTNVLVTEDLDGFPVNEIAQTSLFVFTRNGIDVTQLRERIPEVVCQQLETYLKVLKYGEYVFFDPSKREISIPYQINNIEPVLSIFENRTDEEIVTDDKPIKDQIIEFLEYKNGVISTEEKKELASQVDTNMDYINKIIREAKNHGFIPNHDKKTKFQKLVDILKEDPEISDEILTNRIGSTIDSVLTMRRKAIRFGLVTIEEQSEARQRKYQEKLEELKKQGFTVLA